MSFGVSLRTGEAWQRNDQGFLWPDHDCVSSQVVMQALCPPVLHTGDVIVPDGVRYISETVHGSIFCVIEIPPTICNFSWQNGELSYTDIKLAFPYVILIVLLNSVLDLSDVKIAVRTEPLTSIHDKLFLPPFPNCFAHGSSQHPSNLCYTNAHSRYKQRMRDFGLYFSKSKAITETCAILKDYWLKGGVTMDGNGGNWARERVKGLYPVGEWAQNTKEDPSFILRIPFPPLGKTLAQTLEDSGFGTVTMRLLHAFRGATTHGWD